MSKTLEFECEDDVFEEANGEPGSLARFIAKLQEALSAMPEQYREDARCLICYTEAFYDSSAEYTQSVYYTRDQTVEERAQELADEENRRKTRRAEAESQERATLFFLKQKYER